VQQRGSGRVCGDTPAIPGQTEKNLRHYSCYHGRDSNPASLITSHKRYRFHYEVIQTDVFVMQNYCGIKLNLYNKCGQFGMKKIKTEFRTAEDYKNNCFTDLKYLAKRKHELMDSECKVSHDACRQRPRIFNHYDLQI
jgi:hypothetical protein